MPTLRITTNLAVPAPERDTLLARASATVAEMLAKPESYVMVILEDGRPMRFGASAEPAAYLELKSLGLDEGRTPEYSQTLCGLVGAQIGVPANRVYIEFASPPRHLFGWDGRTF